jgi:uncharacterized protein YyaL (SSP411 family)
LNNIKNHLSSEKSPYLLQHADNPVDWYPWGNEAFERAKKEHKPIFLSIGYSTCHWCHVMAHESFEDDTVAKLLNDNFICIKVDREERPDIDNIYMTICQLMIGSGGWPLTIIMTPEKKPFFAATYIPKNNRFGRIGLIELIPQIKELWEKKQDDVYNLANQLNITLDKFSHYSSGEMLDKNILKMAFDQLKNSFDNTYGGFGKAPKFPIPHNLFFLLRYWRKNNDKDALNMVEKTLDALRNGGIYDQIGYGFHRYSTDNKWIIPHFEKMLYDQALLAIAYTEAFQATGKSVYEKTAREILEYVLRVMTAPQGGFYSAEDADSEGQEGKFYLWDYEEIQKILDNKEFEIFTDLFDIKKEGNYIDESIATKTGQNIIYAKTTLSDLAKKKNIDIKQIEKIFNSARKKLFSYREKRIHPEKDDKVLTDWNGLMIAAFAKASQAFNEEKYINAAEKAINFILKNINLKDGGLYHRYRDNESAIPGNLSDYAFLIYGLVNLYQSTYKTKYLEYALKFNGYLFDHFWDDSNGGFYFSADNAEELLVRKKEIYDGAIPSGNSIALLNLIQLSRYTNDVDLEENANKLVKVFSKEVNKLPASYSQFMIGLDFLLGPSYEVVIAGKKTEASVILNKINKHFIPNKIVIFRSTEEESPDILNYAKYTKDYLDINGKPAIYICSNYSCQSPITDVNKAINSLKEKIIN